ncbi:hypothetical protein [Deinococcus hopiensis]|uniref:hypothetical protein n=1 Tax=Deinococcus hopiensis TaxID=309885 RepID=UPI00111C7980|nr:hypothetical protein [Deinococcus hopiensis]
MRDVPPQAGIVRSFGWHLGPEVRRNFLGSIVKNDLPSIPGKTEAATLDVIPHGAVTYAKLGQQARRGHSTCRGASRMKGGIPNHSDGQAHVRGHLPESHAAFPVALNDGRELLAVVLPVRPLVGAAPLIGPGVLA